MKNYNIKFASKPSEEIRTELKNLGFRWSPKNCVWWTNSPADIDEQVNAIVTAIEGAELLNGKPEGEKPAKVAKEVKTAKTNADSRVKFFWNGIKIDGVMFTGYWNKSIDRDGVLKGYRLNAKESYFDYSASGEYDRKRGELIRKFFEVNNNSDMMTDYFEKDSLLISPESQYLAEAEQAYRHAEIKNVANNVKYYEKRAATNRIYEKPLQEAREKLERLTA